MNEAKERQIQLEKTQGQETPIKTAACEDTIVSRESTDAGGAHTVDLDRWPFVIANDSNRTGNITCYQNEIVNYNESQ